MVAQKREIKEGAGVMFWLLGLWVKPFNNSEQFLHLILMTTWRETGHLQSFGTSRSHENSYGWKKATFFQEFQIPRLARLCLFLFWQILKVLKRNNLPHSCKTINGEGEKNLMEHQLIGCFFFFFFFFFYTCSFSVVK